MPVAASTAPTAPVPSPLWPVLSAAVPAAVTGARSAVIAARERRAAGTDRTSRAVRALRRGLAIAAAGLSGARTAGGGLRARVRAGMDVARTRRAAQESVECQESVQDTTDDTQVPAEQAGTGEHEQDTTERAEGSSAPAQDTTPEETPVSTTPNTTVGGTELATLAELRAEIGEVDARIAEAAELLSVVIDWAATLPERYVAAPFGTDGLNGAVVAAAEALASLPNLDELAELLATVTDEATKADALGEVADELGATGDVGAFRAA